MENNEGPTEQRPPELGDAMAALPTHKQLDLWPEAGVRARLSRLRGRISSIWKHRHSRFRRRFVVGFSVACVVGILVWLWTHWTDPDRDFKITNFLAAFYPVPLSVFIAFLPDMERSEKMRPVWRFGIVGAGLFYSLILWHQQAVNLASSRSDQQKIVAAAVQKSNDHADQQIEGVRKRLTDVSGHSDEQFEQVAEHSDNQIAVVRGDLKNTTKGISDLLSKTSVDLSSSISKVGKPDPPVPARLRFCPFSADCKATNPLPFYEQLLKPDKDGIFSVDVTMVNISLTTVHAVDTWLDICRVCSFAKEPEGYSKLSGMSDQTRWKQIQLLNPGSALAKVPVEVKVPKEFESFDISGRYSCEVCVGDAPPQIIRVHMLKTVE